VIEVSDSKEANTMERRSFLTAMGGAAMIGSGTSKAVAADDFFAKLAPPAETVRGDMRYRKFGRHNDEISAIGLGGFHIGVPKDEAESVRLIRTAIDAGVTFMDNSWDYHDGMSEVRMGKALKEGYRGKVFLMTKIDGRTKKLAAKQIDESLKRLQTDRIDLMQHHEIIRLEDPDMIFNEGGAQEAMLEAQKAGKIRYIGFTGHKDPMVHLRMLDHAAKRNFVFDAVQMPINVMDAHFRSFTKEVLPRLVEKGIAVLGMKSMGGGEILKSNSATPTECLHFALTMPTSTVISGMEKEEVLKKNLEAVKNFKPMSADEIAAVLAKTQSHASAGKFEGFKTTSRYDATARNPSWLE
jgi:predicted aldo/keto reductase-like oxidoreductase